MDNKSKLYQHLSDGKPHSDHQLARLLNISKQQVTDIIMKFINLGILVHQPTDHEYQLTQHIQLLDHNHIHHFLSPTTRSLLTELDIVFDSHSTNSDLFQQANQGKVSGSVLLTECQYHGHGRQGRVWFSPFGCNIYLSLLLRFTQGISSLTGLGLVQAIALAKALNELGIMVGIKWPNDILVSGKKLAGILVEVGGQSQGNCFAVIGIGMNVSMPSTAKQSIDQPWTDLKQLMGKMVSRNQIVATLLNHLFTVNEDYKKLGLNALLDQWSTYDLCLGQPVTLLQQDKKITGIGAGITKEGAFCLQQSDNTYQHFYSGDIQLRINNPNKDHKSS